MPIHRHDADPLAYAQTAGERERRFWLGMLYTGAAGYIGALVTMCVYVAFTWQQPHRGWTAAILAIAMVFIAVTLALRHVIVVSRYRIHFFCFWDLSSFAILAVELALDRGYASPMALLLGLPMLFLAVGYPRRAVLLCGGAVLIMGMLVVPFSPPGLGYSAPILGLMSLVIGLLLALFGAVFRDRQQADLESLRLRLEHLAATDELTGCLNQRAFNDALSRHIAEATRHGKTLTLLVIDIDFFKQINDRHGHIMGDEVLRQVGEALRSTARESDAAGRPGGDELALLAPETDSEGARLLSERLLACISARVDMLEVTVSIGICTAIPQGEPSATFFRRADSALYEAKRLGRNRSAAWPDGAQEPPLAWLGTA